MPERHLLVECGGESCRYPAVVCSLAPGGIEYRAGGVVRCQGSSSLQHLISPQMGRPCWSLTEVALEPPSGGARLGIIRVNQSPFN